jgi:superfamily II RNA helicase
MTGDIKMNPDGQCIIMTTEILRNILYKKECEYKYENEHNNEHNNEYNNEHNNEHNNEKEIKNAENSLINIDDVGAVIFDEVHYINDPDRGKVWEESIILLPKNINLVMLSATIDKPEAFSSWIGNIKETPINLIPTSHRVVPLKHYFWKPSMVENPKSKKMELKFDLVEILDDKGKFKNYDLIRRNYKSHDISKIMDKLIDFLITQNYIPALFFKFSRNKCETICKTVRKTLLNHEEISQLEGIFNHYMKDYKKIYEILPQYQDVYKQLLRGVVYHHSGLIPILKEIIEILYSKGLVKVLFATETFAIGVNMPTKTVLFTDLTKFDNNGLRQLRSDEYLQMSGRAGRRGLDTFGSVIILPTIDIPCETDMKRMMTGKSPQLISKFKLSYQFVLKTLYSGSFDINTFLSKTLIMNENEKRVLHMYFEKEKLEDQIKNIVIDENNLIILKDYQKIMDQLNDTFFTLKKKDKERLENDKKVIEENPNFKIFYEEYKLLNNYKRELETVNHNINWCSNSIKDNIQIIIKILQEENYVNDSKLTVKGVIATGINECQELLFTEMIFRGLLDNLEFPEIIAILSSFINEKDQNGGDRYLSDLKVSKPVISVLKELMKMSEYFINMEDKNKLYINSDYKIYLDFIEPAYIWASGKSIKEVYQFTNMYDGNFVKTIMRINNICENLVDICKSIERFDLYKKMEFHTEILIRDITSINSLYVS